MTRNYDYSNYEEMIADSAWRKRLKYLNIARPRDLTHLGLKRTQGHRIWPILDAEN